jgi:hypothetical protein
MKRRFWCRFFLFGFILACLLHICALSNCHKITPDGILYTGLARSILAGDGPSFNGQEGTIVPPAFPMFLTIPLKLAGTFDMAENWVVWTKFFQTLVIFLLAWGSYKLACQYLDSKTAMLVAFLMICNIGIFQYSTLLTSDILYTCVGVWSLYVFNHRNVHVRRYLFPIMLSLLLLTRAVGIAMIAAYLLHELFVSITGKCRCRPVGVHGTGTLQSDLPPRCKSDRIKFKKKLSMAIIISALAYLPYAFWNAQYGLVHLNYAGILKKLIASKGLWGGVQQMVNHAGLTATRCVQMVLNIEDISIGLYFTLPVFALMLITFAIILFKRTGLAELYMLSYLGISSLWWYDQGVRYFLPLLPLFLIYSFVGLQHVAYSMPGILCQKYRIAWTAGLVLLSVPLLQYVWCNKTLPTPIVIIRDGYAYCLLALFWMLALLVPLPTKCKRYRSLRIMLGSVVTVSFLTFLTYLGAYILLEHRILDYRKPMLCGYDIYYEMGQWLKNQKVPQPILCSYSSIIHFSSGKITTMPHDSDIDFGQIKEQTQRKQVGSVFCFSPKTISQDTDDHFNRQLINALKQNPAKCRIISCDQAGRYMIYRVLREN